MTWPLPKLPTSATTSAGRSKRSAMVLQRRLERHGAVLLQPVAGRVERRLRIEPVLEHVDQHLHVALRLELAAGDAEHGRPAAVGIEQGGRDDGVEGTLAGANPLGWPGGSTNPEPRFWSMKPWPGTITWEPKP